MSVLTILLISCAKEGYNENKFVALQNQVTARAGEWKFAYTFHGIGNKCISPPKDCGAFRVGEEAISIQDDLDFDLTETGVQNFFLSQNAGVLFPSFNGPILAKLQSGDYRMYKITNQDGEDLYLAGQGNVSLNNYEFVLRLDK